MNAPTTNETSPRRTANTLILFAAIAGCAYLLMANLRFDSYGHRTMRQVVHNESPPRLASLREIDDAAHRALDLAGGENVLVSADSDPRALSILHPRAVYALWPRRLFAAGPNTVILDSAQIGPATRPSDPAWLRENHVTATVRFGITDNRLTVERVDPISLR